MIRAFGQSKSAHAWSLDARATVSDVTITKRLATGMSAEDAITKPASKGGRRKRQRQPEEALQRAVAEYLDLRGLLWCHVPNERPPGGKSDHAKSMAAAQRKRLKGLGVKPGVPDVMIYEPFVKNLFPCLAFPYAEKELSSGRAIFRPLHYHPGLAIELKLPTDPVAGTKKTYTSPDQKRWLAALCERGWRTEVCRTVDEVMAICDECYGPFGG
jgi:hypothetical protein